MGVMVTSCHRRRLIDLLQFVRDDKTDLSCTSVQSEQLLHMINEEEVRLRDVIS